MRRAALLLLLPLALPVRCADAVQLDALETGKDWRVRALRFHGNGALATKDLRAAMTTTTRRWWTVWRPYPSLDPITLRTDLEHLARLYRGHGYYHARIVHDVELPAKGTTVAVDVWIDEGPPVRVTDVGVALEGVPLPDEDRRRLLTHLPLARDDVFTEAAYDETLSTLRTYYREHGFAHVEVAKQATVDAMANTASVHYRVTSGEPTVFGTVDVTGTEKVSPDVVRREVAFQAGQPFRQSLLDETRRNVVGLHLFRSVRLEERGDGRVVDVAIRVREGPSHEVRLGAGYDTEEQVRGLASWRDYNFFGGGRQLGFTARASFIRRTIAADFVQPHFPGAQDDVRLIGFEQQEEEDTFDDDRARISPRIDWRALPTLTPYAFYRFEYDSLSNVRARVRARFPDIAPHHALLSGLGVGLDWKTVDDLLDPTRGFVATTSIEPVGGFLGGDVSFVRLLSELRRYQPLGAGFTGAARLRLGTEKTYGGTHDVPLFERLYAGGINSVRGYDRWRVGPLVDDHPIGGKSLVDWALELRHPITQSLGAAVFLDAGQVRKPSFSLPLDALRYGTGLAVRYRSPVGPISLALGFPLQPHGSDQRWQVYASIGQAF